MFFRDRMLAAYAAAAKAQGGTTSPLNRSSLRTASPTYPVQTSGSHAASRDDSFSSAGMTSACEVRTLIHCRPQRGWSSAPACVACISTCMCGQRETVLKGGSVLLQHRQHVSIVPDAVHRYLYLYRSLLCTCHCLATGGHASQDM